MTERDDPFEKDLTLRMIRGVMVQVANLLEAGMKMLDHVFFPSAPEQEVCVCPKCGKWHKRLRD